VGLQESLKKEITTLNVGCRVKLIRSVLNDSELKLLDETLQNDNISTAAIVRALKTEGYDASIHSVGRHRRGDCVCGIKRIT
jgi:ABC-type Mn2+/Zn2+ transport system ATPase subunit